MFVDKVRLRELSDLFWAALDAAKDTFTPLMACLLHGK